MKRCVYAWLIALLFPATTLAQCPVQKTVILYLNGVDTIEKSAKASMKLIEEKVSKIPGVLTDCIKFDYIYNTNEVLFTDFIEAGMQKAAEQGLNTSDFWRWFFRSSPFTSGFADLLVDFYSNTNTSIDLGLFVLGDQAEEHLAKIREYLAQGKRVILVSHSQGNLYANEEWNQLTEGEKSQTHIVAVATPADQVADDGSYTTLEEDRVAHFLFPRALAANVSNEENCGDDWTCHGFKESYMRGKNSRERIVEEIVALLPVHEPEQCRIEGVIMDWYYENVISGARVALLNNRPPYNMIAEFSSNATGHYCVPKNVADGYYWLEAYLPNDEWLGGRNVGLRSGQVIPIVIDFPIAVPM